MLATFAIAVPSPAGLVVPRSAVLLEGDGSYVYIARGQTFRRQPVSIGVTAADSVQLVGGVAAGESVVVRGAQLLESERLKSQLRPADKD
jgi:hypothetical protein